MTLRSRILRRLRRVQSLRQDKSGVAFVEFAYVLPILLVLGMGGLEIANLAIINMRISQAAMHVGDNASRLGDRDALVAQKIYENDINELFLGVAYQAGAGTDLFENGRVIISSLEQNSDGGQWIHWQRCMGKKQVNSAYGPQGTGASGTGFAGMGPPGKELQAASGQAIIFIEIEYDYQPIIGNAYAMTGIKTQTISSTAAFNVRGSRDLSQLFQTVPAAPVRSCNKYEAV